MAMAQPAGCGHLCHQWTADRLPWTASPIRPAAPRRSPWAPNLRHLSGWNGTGGVGSTVPASVGFNAFDLQRRVVYICIYVYMMINDSSYYMMLFIYDIS